MQTRVRSNDEGPSSGMSMAGDAAVDLRDGGFWADDLCEMRDVLAAVDFRVETRPGILLAEGRFRL